MAGQTTLGVTHILRLSEQPGRGPFSGAENHLMTLLPELARQGVDAELLVILFRPGPTIRGRLADLEASGVAVTIVQCDLTRRWRWLGLRTADHIARLVPFLKERRGRIIHIHLDRVIGVVASLLARCPLVMFSIHADEPWLRETRRRAWSRLVDRVAVHYIAITDHVKRFYASVSGARENKITRIHYGFDLPPLRRSREEMRRAYGIPQDRFVAGFVGRLAYQKNVPLLIQALGRIPEIHGVVVGDGPLEAELRELAQVHGVSNLQFLGHQPNASEIMAAFDLFCLPSRFEGLGLVLIEAMLRRTPIVGSRAGAIPEILCDGAHGLLFDSEDLEALVHCLRRAFDHQDRMEQMAEEAYEYAVQAFSVDRMGRETVEVYRKVAM